MGSSWKPLLLLSVAAVITELATMATGPPPALATILRIHPAGFSPAGQRNVITSEIGHSTAPPGLRLQHLPRHLYRLDRTQSLQHQDEQEDHGPDFIHEPHEQIIPTQTEGRKVTLHCEAHGKPKPSYRWFRNGTILDPGGGSRYSQVSGSLIIDRPNQAKDSGTYQCLASNSLGSILSREAQLRFTYLGNFSDHRRGPVSVRQGQGVVLMCSPPPHSAEVTYGWVFNIFPTFVDQDSRRFISQKTGNLYIAKVQPSDLGSYICLLKDILTRRRVLSPPTPLTLRTDGVMGEYEPKIEVHFPPIVEVSQGSTASLECFALGNPVPTITWRKLNGNLPTRARLRKSQAVLEVLNIQTGDAGIYECKVENTRGGNAVRGLLQVYTRPYWEQAINDTTLDSGQELRWECRAVGRPRPSYRWLKNGESLTSQTRVTVINGLLTIVNLRRSDAGMYQCVAENKHGSVFTSAELQILASAPSFDLYPVGSEILVCVGQELVVECRPRSSPKAAITWRKDERLLLDSERVSISQDGTLRISSVTRSDSGSYTCRAENIFGVSSSSGTVYVKDVTELQLTPSQVEVTVGESVVLTCRATHDSSLQVHFLWSHDGQPIDFQREGDHFEHIRAQASSADLMIRNIQLKHAGRFTCRVWTAADGSSGTAGVLVRGPPGPPGVVIVEEISGTTATMSWSRGLDNHSPVTRYNLQARSPFSLGWQTVKTVPDPITGYLESAMAIELSPWIEYEFRVVATNRIGTGDPSVASRVVRTEAAIPSVPPASVSGGGGKRKELVIVWEPVSEEFQHGEGFGYIVAFRPNGTRGWREKMVSVPDVCRYVYRDESLRALTPFEVKVGVYNNKGDGSFSPTTIVYSAEGEPQTAPSNITIASLSASEIEVSWHSLHQGSRKPQGYQVSVWKHSHPEDSRWIVRTSGNVSSRLVPGLEGNTLYMVTVRAYNSAGVGPSSAPRTVLTKKSPPSQAPLNILWHQDGSAVSLGWEPVHNMDNESEVMGYKVLYRQEGHSWSQVIETREPSAIVLLPQDGVYIIEVRAFSEGGDGTISSQIRVPKSSGSDADSCSPVQASSTSVTLILALVLPSASW